MSREAIESFVDEIRDDLPKLRRAIAFIHACPDDRDTLLEAHRLTHSIKGTAALVGVMTLGEISHCQEVLFESLITGRLAIDDRLRDTLERITDVIESFANGLQLGSVPEQQLLNDARELYHRHVAVEETEAATPMLGNDAECDARLQRAEHVANVLCDFRDEAIEHLRVMAGMLDAYRRDRMRWDLLADVRRRVHSLKGTAREVGSNDFAHLAHHAEDLLQRLLDRSVAPTESAADCLQACVDALEECLNGTLDESLLEPLHERLAEICGVAAVQPTVQSEPVQVSEIVAEPLEPVAEPLEPIVQDAAPAVTVTTESNPPQRIETAPFKPLVVMNPTDPASIELDDRNTLSDEMLDVFNEEVEEHLRVIYSAFAALEKNPGQMSLIQDVRRSAHTIKGAAGSVRLQLVSKLSHRMEDLLDELFDQQQPVTSSQLALLFDTTDTLQDLIHGNYAAEGMQVAVAQLFDSYNMLLGSERGVASDERSVVSGETSIACALDSSGDSNPEAELSEPSYDGEHERQETPAEAVSDAEAVVQSVAQVGDSPVEVVEFEEPVDVPALAEASGDNAEKSSELIVDDVLPMLTAWNRLAEPSDSVPTRLMNESTGSNESPRSGESLRVPIERVDSLMREVGELIINRSAFAQRMSDFARCVEELQRAVERMRGTSQDLDTKYGVGALGGRRPLRGDGASALPSRRRIDDRHLNGPRNEEFDSLEFDRYTEFHLISRALAETTADIGTVGGELQNLIGDFDQLLNRQGRLSRDTQDRLMRIRMVPLGTLATKLHRTVRVVAGQQNKLVDFLIQGGEVELDKLVLEELADPLMHILRNAVDHGVELPASRAAAGKSERATIRVQAFYQGTQVVIRVLDDGNGLNLDLIRETALRNGVVQPSDVENLSDDELAAFIFLPGFSTARELSEVSGRGVGMDIVRDKVQKLKGSVSVGFQAGQGTTFTIRLPITMAVTRALLIHASNETFALPMQSVVQILRLERKDIEQLGPNPIIRLGEDALPLVYLADKLRLRHPADKSSEAMPVLVLAAGEQKIAVAVDKILHGRDIVVKTLGSHLRKVKGLIGATLMGDGSVVPILDTASLVGHSGTVTRSTYVPSPHLATRRHEPTTVMVVDDSVSVRRVMASLLKSNGFTVIDAKDGLDALEKLRQADRQPDLFLLDIEMPRMDGYELLTSLRSHLEHCNTPVVMVTSRAGDKHRQKAMQLGATDYVIKPYQDAELLSLIRRTLAHVAAKRDREQAVL